MKDKVGPEVPVSQVPPHDLQADKVGRVSSSYLVGYAARHDMWYLSCGSLAVPVVEGDSRMRNVLVMGVLMMLKMSR